MQYVEYRYPCPLSAAYFVFYGTAALAVFLLSRLADRWEGMVAKWGSAASPIVKVTDVDVRREVRNPRILTTAMLATALGEPLSRPE